MNKALAATAVFSHAASAADIAVYNGEIPVTPVDVGVFDWSGPYIGGHLGYGWSEQLDDMPPAAGEHPA